MGFIDQYPMHISNLRRINVSLRIDKDSGLASAVRDIFDHPGLAKLEKFDVTIYTTEKTLEAAARELYALARVWIRRVAQREDDQCAVLKILYISSVMSHSKRTMWSGKGNGNPFMDMFAKVVAEKASRLRSDTGCQA